MTDLAHDQPTAGQQAPTRSILVIDDDPDIQLVLGFTLEEAGLRPVAAVTGEQGLQLAAEGPVDAALVDLRLPGLNGLELIPSLRARSPMPIIVITAQTEGTDTATALRLGADDYLTKPFTPRDLIRRLTAQLAPCPAAVAWGRLAVDPTNAVRFDGRRVELTLAERRLLVTFMAAGGRALGPNELLTQVWGYPGPGDHTIVASMIGRVQDRLEQAGGAGLLVAEPPARYRLHVPM